MSVSIRVFQNGNVVSEEIYEGKLISDVLKYFEGNGIQYRTDKECEEAYEITRDKDIKIMCIDNTNVLGVEGTANFISEYMLEYDEKVHEDLKEILLKTITIGEHKLTEFQFKELLRFCSNTNEGLYHVVENYYKTNDLQTLEDYFANHIIDIREDKNQISFIARDKDKYNARVPIKSKV